MEASISESLTTISGTWSSRTDTGPLKTIKGPALECSNINNSHHQQLLAVSSVLHYIHNHYIEYLKVRFWRFYSFVHFAGIKCLLNVNFAYINKKGG